MLVLGLHFILILCVQRAPHLLPSSPALILHRTYGVMELVQVFCLFLPVIIAATTMGNQVVVPAILLITDLTSVKLVLKSSHVVQEPCLIQAIHQFVAHGTGTIHLVLKAQLMLLIPKVSSIELTNWSSTPGAVSDVLQLTVQHNWVETLL